MMEKMTFECTSCHAVTEDCYTDSGALGMAHGQCQCRDCFIADGHPECPICHGLTSRNWLYCAHCGTPLTNSTRLAARQEVTA